MILPRWAFARMMGPRSRADSHDSLETIMLRRIPQVALSLALFAGIFAAQTPAKVDFGRDILPIVRQRCVGCHGPSQQMGGLRADRKSSVLSFRRVVPNGLENSLLYKRLNGSSQYGAQMPLTGSLRPEQISLIKTWIE